MKKRTESEPQLRLQSVEPAFARNRRSWLTVAVLASQPFQNARVASADAGTWIHRQRLN